MMKRPILGPLRFTMRAPNLLQVPIQPRHEPLFAMIVELCITILAPLSVHAQRHTQTTVSHVFAVRGLYVLPQLYDGTRSQLEGVVGAVFDQPALVAPTAEEDFSMSVRHLLLVAEVVGEREGVGAVHATLVRQDNLSGEFLNNLNCHWLRNMIKI